MVTDFLYNVFAFDDESPLLFTQQYFWVFFATSQQVAHAQHLFVLCERLLLL